MINFIRRLFKRQPQLNYIIAEYQPPKNRTQYYNANFFELSEMGEIGAELDTLLDTAHQE
jgi:hypothetical protein